MFKFYTAIIFSLFLLNSCEHSQDLRENKTFQTVQGSLDIPLAKNLQVRDDDVINFDSFNGNIISISYSTQDDLTKVKNFYLRTLPQMGWEIVANEFLDNSDIIYLKRDKETLEIEFLTTDDNEEEKLVKFFGKLDN